MKPLRPVDCKGLKAKDDPETTLIECCNLVLIDSLDDDMNEGVVKVSGRNWRFQWELSWIGKTWWKRQDSTVVSKHSRNFACTMNNSI